MSARNRPALDSARMMLTLGFMTQLPAGEPVSLWHGAAPDTAMTHIALVEQLDGKAVDWKEHVSDARYAAPVAPRETAVGWYGELAPK